MSQGCTGSYARSSEFERPSTGSKDHANKSRYLEMTKRGWGLHNDVRLHMYIADAHVLYIEPKDESEDGVLRKLCST